ncbi:CpsD/CapB family tyrosine-protein kinase [Pullulanibacillus sp. KACC 23026]|uniref:CpsD/CapB family tyrosine-protein kinase n=1 Tax=Pullulanibacillus sp. KACC 23026 TaxID=3028315 RepID=UPI0023B05E56|nr:CpsD/CapB family tyrosine-protein kinase [Pullulanibacillus sp. KACC 23026]WEG11523.1 CpsD/CapB family tyrosine-protein kinase [Pullulanibacillus sp. KACC 23026]
MRHFKDNKKEIVIKRHLTSYYYPKSQIAEDFRKARTSLQFLPKNSEIQTMILTSAEYGEGKTTCLVNLGVSLSQLGKKVLLVDTDLRKPSLHKIFTKNSELGLSYVLKGQSLLEEAIYPTGIKTLDVLPCGPIPPYPAEVLVSVAMKRFMKQVKSMYDYILFDSPPVLEVTDTSILAHQCDGTLLVASSGKTSYKKILEAKKLLEQSEAKLIGSILNKRVTR